MKLNKIAATLLIASLLISCGGGSSENGSSTEKTESPSEEGVVRVITYDSQKFDADMYEVSEGLVKIEYVLDGFQSHTLVIEGMEETLVGLFLATQELNIVNEQHLNAAIAASEVFSGTVPNGTNELVGELL